MKKLLFDLFPVIVFFVAYMLGNSNADAANAILASVGLPQPPGISNKPGIYLATVVAIVASFAQVGWLKLRGHQIETLLWVSLGIIVVFGGATLLLHDAKFIMWKPTILYWLTAAFFLTAQLFGRNPTKGLMGAQIEAPIRVWNWLNVSWVGFFTFLGVANLYVAQSFSEETWVKFKLFGVMGLMFVFMIGQGLFLTKYLDKTGHHKEEE
ncbi:MAG: septation protein A [Pseudomonadota bacterium]